MVELTLAKNQDWFKGSYYEKLLGSPWVYDHGLPFSNILAHNLDDLMQRIQRNKASLLIIDGGVGEGKTTLGVHAADYVNIRYGDGVPINLKGPQLSLGGEQFKNKILVCHDEKLLVIVYDEAGDFDKKTTLSRFNRDLMRIFEMYRGFKILVILCLPRFYKLENELFDLAIPRLLIHCLDRTDTHGDFRAYDLEQMYYIKQKAKDIIVKPKCYDHGMVNFFGHFLNLPPDRSRELDMVSIAAKRAATRNIIKNVKDLVTIQMIADHFNMSDDWVRLRLKNIEVGPVVKRDRKVYYKKELIDKIEGTLKK